MLPQRAFALYKNMENEVTERAAQLTRGHDERIQTCHVAPPAAVIKGRLMMKVSKTGKPSAIWLKLAPCSGWFLASSCGILRRCQTK